MLDSVDRLLLDIIQSDFPIEPDPYGILGKKAGISREEAFERIRKMKRENLIRRIGANFQSSCLGFVSTLCGAKVPESKKADFISDLNSLVGVTHNYERAHEFNIWFTLISHSKREQERILAELEQKHDLQIMNLPAERLYKIKVEFPMQ